jgi:hypothetical protein
VAAWAGASVVNVGSRHSRLETTDIRPLRVQKTPIGVKTLLPDLPRALLLRGFFWPGTALGITRAGPP